MASEARAEVTRELGPELRDLSLRDLEPRRMVRKHLLEPADLDDLDAPARGNGRAAGRGTPAYDEDVT